MSTTINDNANTLISSLPPSISQQIPETPLCKALLHHAISILEPAIFNHSLRVYLLSKWLAEKEAAIPNLDLSLLFSAAIGHDFGASETYNGQQRFEVEGADATVSQMHDCGITDEQSTHKVWVAIALHTSPGIAERIDPFTRLIRLGVKMDFSPAVRDTMGAKLITQELETYLPRLNIEKVLGDTVVKQAEKIPVMMTDGKDWPPDSRKHPKASWPGILLRAHVENPEYEGVNTAF